MIDIKSSTDYLSRSAGATFSNFTMLFAGNLFFFLFYLFTPITFFIAIVSSAHSIRIFFESSLVINKNLI